MMQQPAASTSAPILALIQAIAACPRREACEILLDALAEFAVKPPVPPLFGVMGEARSWAEFATRRELKAYGLACYEALSPKDQCAFLVYLRERAT